MAAIFTGLLLFFGDKLSFDGLAGNIILGGVALAAMVLCLRGLKDGQPANTILLGNIAGILVGLPSLVQERWALKDLGIILYLGLFQIGLSFVLYTIAIKHVRALESTLILTLEPILNPVWVFLVLGEVPSPLALTGCAVVAIAVTARAIHSARAEAEETARVTR